MKRKLKKLYTCFCVCLFLMLLCSCENSIDTRENWVSGEPSVFQKTENTILPTEDDNSEADSEEIVIEKTQYSAEDIAKALYNDSLDFTEMLWYGLKPQAKDALEEKMENGYLTYYLSEEGDDANDGMSPEKPRKSLEKYSNLSNINILLKCGETYDMTTGFNLGSNVVMGFYGDGERPRINFYQEIDREWKPAPGYTNVWMLDLAETVFDNDAGNQTNCNIGHLLIDGQVNWKRLCVFENTDYNFPEYLAECKDYSWGVDFKNKTLYMYDDRNPNQRNIQFALNSNALNVSNSRNSSLIGLEFMGAGRHGISMVDATNIEVCSC